MKFSQLANKEMHSNPLGEFLFNLGSERVINKELRAILKGWKEHLLYTCFLVPGLSQSFHPVSLSSYTAEICDGQKKNLFWVISYYSDMKPRLHTHSPFSLAAEERALIIIIYELKILFSLFNIYLKPLKSKKFLQE